MPFVFGTLDAPTQDRFAGTGETVQTLSMHMMDAWIAFARSGNPNHPGLALWPAFDGSTRSTMIFDRRCEVVNDPFSDERQVIQTDG
jgi:para-nitrobenzyl esterase